MIETDVNILSKFLYKVNRMYCCIPVDEYLFQRFEKPATSFYYSRAASYFNHWGKLVASEILQRKNSEDRVQVVSYFIHLAIESTKTQDYFSAFAVASGLGFSSVTRLKSTWSRLNKKELKKYQKLQNLVDPNNNFHTYRDALKNREI